MTLPEPKACAVCVNCTFVSGMYLCTLPPECFDLGEHDIDRDAHLDLEWVGMNCDRSRHQEEMCGPGGKMWRQRRA